VEEDTVSRAAIALGAVAPTVVRVREAESRIVGASISAVAEHADDIVEAYRPYIRPISDQRSTAEYRRDVAAGLVKRFLSERLA
jgi:CO/xanthine dehydrogenase FAD-binding subunit